MHHPLKNALPIVAAAYGKKFGVKVAIQGNDAYTDGQQIVIPASDMDDPRYQKIAWGYLAHEAAHVRHTDFNVVAHTRSQPLRKALLNIIEDARIEERLARDYPGTRHTIHAVLSYMVEQGLMEMPKQVAPAVVLQSWLLCYLRCQYLKQSVLEPLYRKSAEQLQRILDPEAIKQLTALADQVAGLENTEETLALTDQIVALLEFVADKPPSHTEPEPKQNKDYSSAGQTAQQILEATDSELMADLFKQVSDELKGQALNTQNDGIKPLNLPQPEQAQGGSLDLLKQAASTSAHLRAQLQGLVQATQENRIHPKRHGRGIDLKRLARSQTGETKLFIKRQPRIAPNTAVHLLVDISGSMSKSNPETGQRNYQLANQAALALALALEGIPGVEPAVSYFPGHRSDVSEVLRAGQSARKQSAFFDQKPRGCTPMAPAIWFAANELLQQRQPRKLLIIITDGAPDDEATTRDVIDRCRLSGFELLGIGVQTNSVEQLFTDSVVISKLSELKQELFRAVNKAVLTA